MREKVGVKVVKALQRKDDGVNHAAIDMLCALMQVNLFTVAMVTLF
jgi:DnaJ family protein C protein 13